MPLRNYSLTPTKNDGHESHQCRPQCRQQWPQTNTLVLCNRAIFSSYSRLGKQKGSKMLSQFPKTTRPTIPKRKVRKVSFWESLVLFFILPGLTRANPGIYLAVLFYQEGVKKLPNLSRYNSDMPGYPGINRVE